MSDVQPSAPTASMLHMHVDPIVRHAVVEGLYKTDIVTRAPLPGAKSDLPAPSRRRELEKEGREKELADRSSEYHEKQGQLQKKEKRSFMDKAHAKLNSVSHKLDKVKTGATQSAHDMVAEKLDKHAEERYQKAYPELQETEKLVYHDYCVNLVNTVTTEDPLPHFTHLAGSMMCTNKSLLFVADSKQHPSVRIPLEDIVSIHLAVKLDTEDPTPCCVPLPHSRVIPHGILVYTRQGPVHRLFDVKPTVGTASTNQATSAFGILDWAWRECHLVIPLPDYQYAGIQQPNQVTLAEIGRGAIQDLQVQGTAAVTNVTTTIASTVAEAKADPKKAIENAKATFSK